MTTNRIINPRFATHEDLLAWRPIDPVVEKDGEMWQWTEAYANAPYEVVIRIHTNHPFTKPRRACPIHHCVENEGLFMRDNACTICEGPWI